MKMLCGTFFILVLIGCSTTHTPHYSLDDLNNVIQPEKTKFMDMTIAVALFDDKRQPSPIFRGRVKFLKVISGGIESMIVKHFDHVKLFARQEVLNEHIVPTRRKIEELKAKGCDAVLVGNIEEYAGYQIETGNLEAVAAILASPLLFALSGLENVTCIGSVKLTDLKIIETSSGHVIWQGQTSGEAFGRHQSYSASRIADDALKTAVTSLAEQLEHASFK